jgi:hypothetical protein
MNAERFLQMLEDCVWPIVSDWVKTDEPAFMHDGAPTHFALVGSEVSRTMNGTRTLRTARKKSTSHAL